MKTGPVKWREPSVRLDANIYKFSTMKATQKDFCTPFLSSLVSFPYFHFLTLSLYLFVAYKEMKELER